MRIPLDYDDLGLISVAEDVYKLHKKYHFSAIELYKTSPNHRTVVVELKCDMDKAIEIVQNSACDSEYKEWVAIHRDMTERVTRKNLKGDFPMQLFGARA